MQMFNNVYTEVVLKLIIISFSVYPCILKLMSFRFLYYRNLIIKEQSGLPDWPFKGQFFNLVLFEAVRPREN